MAFFILFCYTIFNEGVRISGCMKTIKKDVIYSQEINKSSFITYLKKVSTVEEARDYIQYVKLEHPDATHHVTAYVIGKTGEYGHANDDGEPSGTAGLPVLDVFRKNNCTNIVVIVVRYFGGIKLGAGGLVRAYSSSASKALLEAGLMDIIEYQKVVLTLSYNHLKIVERLCKDYTILDKDFSTSVRLVVLLPLLDYDDFKDALSKASNNQIIISKE